MASESVKWKRPKVVPGVALSPPPAVCAVFAEWSAVAMVFLDGQWHLSLVEFAMVALDKGRADAESVLCALTLAQQQSLTRHMRMWQFDGDEEGEQVMSCLGAFELMCYILGPLKPGPETLRVNGMMRHIATLARYRLC